MNESGSCFGVGMKCEDFVSPIELIRYIGRKIRKKIEKLTFQALRPVTKILRLCTFGLNGLPMIFCL